jgi:hypothetical protein
MNEAFLKTLRYNIILPPADAPVSEMRLALLKLTAHENYAKAFSVEWVTDRLPRVGDLVLFAYKNVYENYVTAKGFYASRFTIEDIGNSISIEEKDGVFYLEEGWYESCEFGDFKLKYTVDAWTKLPQYED